VSIDVECRLTSTTDLEALRLRWVALRVLKPNRVLAQNILDERGRILLAQGAVITPSLILKLQRLGIGSICIEDPATADINTRTFVQPSTRSLLLEATYQSLEELSSGAFSKTIRPPRIKEKLRPLLEDVIAQLQASDGAGEHLGTVYVSNGELYHHSVHVTFFALSIGLGLGLSEEQLLELGLGTLLHDIGKLRIPDSILRKPSRLTEDEFELVKLHTKYGYEILQRVTDLPTKSILVALEHHERVDGSGYPYGLVDKQIDFYSRISGVADVYEALTANRVYRKGYLPHQAFELLLGACGTQFDLEVIHGFVKTISVYSVGMSLVLSTGHKAVVVHSPRKHTQRPVVRVIENASGDSIFPPYEIDLSKELTVQIVGCES